MGQIEVASCRPSGFTASDGSHWVIDSWTLTIDGCGGVKANISAFLIPCSSSRPPEPKAVYIRELCAAMALLPIEVDDA